MLVGCLCLWLPEALTLKGVDKYSVFLYGQVSLPSWLYFGLCLLAVVGNGLWISSLLFHSYITRTRTIFTAFLYVFVMGCVLPLRGDLGLQVIIFLFVWILQILVDIYKCPQAVSSTYNVGLIIAVMACLYPFAIWLIPIVYVIMLMLQVVSLRSSLAYILGLSTVYWVITGMNLLRGNSFLLPWIELDITWIHDSMVVAIMGILGMLSLWVVVVIYAHWWSFGIRVRIFSNILFVLWLLFPLLALFTGSGCFFYALWSIPMIALFVQYLYVTYSARIHRIVFFAFLVTMLGMYAYSTWFYGMA